MALENCSVTLWSLFNYLSIELQVSGVELKAMQDSEKSKKKHWDKVRALRFSQRDHSLLKEKLIG